jgi:hypothetical protein
MKNLTLAVDEKSLKAARMYAAEHDTTVNALVRNFLDGFAARSHRASAEERAKIRAELAELGKRTQGRIGEWKWNREDLYAERFSRYEHPGLRRFGEGQGTKGR